MSVLTQLLTDGMLALNSEVKLRLLLLYCSVIGNVPESSRRQLIEAAREVASTHEVSDLDAIEVEHVQEAYRRMQAAGDTLERKKVLRTRKL